MRVFPSQSHRIAALVLIAIVVASHIAYTVFSVFQCVSSQSDDQLHVFNNLGSIPRELGKLEI